MEEKDILNLKNHIRNYKPISQNDIAYLLRTLEKRGRSHLIPFFEKHILGKNVSQSSTPQPKRKKKKKKTPTEECYKIKTLKASDFQFMRGKVRVGGYIRETKNAFAISHAILKNIQGDFKIKILPDNKFDFEDHGLIKLQGLVEEYCYSFLDVKCEEWFIDRINAIKTDVRRDFKLNFSNFSFNEENGRYELMDGAIKYAPLNINSLLCEFRDYIDKQIHIPSRYRDSYEGRGTLTNLINKFNKEFSTCLTNILRKYIYYTEKDVEEMEWSGVKPTITVFFKLVDESSTYDCIETPSFFFMHDVVFEFRNLPKGAPYEFSEEAIRSIEACVEQINDRGMYNLLSSNLQSIKNKKTLDFVWDEYTAGSLSFCNLKDGLTYYRLRTANCLLDISDKHYLMAHPRVEDYSYRLDIGHIKKIAYFNDPNYVLSQELPGYRVECYLLANDEYIVLYALDSSKSTYTFKVKSGCIDMAMFLIWSYFSSHIFNKREGKYITIQCLFSSFGIEWYDNMGSPITRNKEGLYQFDLPGVFY